jgi:hypothetical protein
MSPDINKCFQNYIENTALEQTPEAGVTLVALKGDIVALQVLWGTWTCSQWLPLMAISIVAQLLGPVKLVPA